MIAMMHDHSRTGAAEGGHADVVSLLLRHHANVDAQNKVRTVIGFYHARVYIKPTSAWEQHSVPVDAGCGW